MFWKIAAIVGLTAIIAAVVQYVSMLGSENALFERFPDIDPKVVVKAHRILLRRTYAGHYNNVEMTDELCDREFLKIVNELQK